MTTFSYLFILIMTEDGAKNNTNKEIFEEELESRESTFPRERLNINPGHIQ